MGLRNVISSLSLGYIHVHDTIGGNVAFYVTFVSDARVLIVHEAKCIIRCTLAQEL